jgi:molybdate transport system substrate-binding protein
MQFAMKALAEAYTAETGQQVELVVSSSGKLTAQIREGAPYDLFFSADTKYPQAIYETGGGSSSPVTYASGQLVLWSTSKNIQVSIDQLTNNEVKHIAIANPRTAPYGTAAVEVLKQLELFDAVKDKLVYGESISQVNQFIISQAAEMGFTAKSVVLSPNMSDQGNWITIADSLHPPINQAMVVLKNDRGLEKEAEAFAAFVGSEKGLSIMRSFGYK